MLGARNDMVYTRTLVDIYLHEPECTEGKIYFAIICVLQCTNIGIRVSEAVLRCKESNL